VGYVELCCRKLTNAEGSYIDLTLVKGDQVRILRFYDPINIKIEEGFPSPTRGMQIIDVRSKQLEGIGVEVSDFEASWGAIKFLARKVVDLSYENNKP